MAKNESFRNALKSIDGFIAEEDYEEALDIIHSLRNAGSAWTREVATRLEILSDFSEAAVFDLGTYWFEQPGKQAQAKARVLCPGSRE